MQANFDEIRGFPWLSREQLKNKIRAFRLHYFCTILWHLHAHAKKLCVMFQMYCTFEMRMNASSNCWLSHFGGAIMYYGLLTPNFWFLLCQTNKVTYSTVKCSIFWQFCFASPNVFRECGGKKIQGIQ